MWLLHTYLLRNEFDMSVLQIRLSYVNSRELATKFNLLAFGVTRTSSGSTLYQGVGKRRGYIFDFPEFIKPFYLLVQLLLAIIGTIAFNTSLGALYTQPLCVVMFCDIEL